MNMTSKKSMLHVSFPSKETVQQAPLNSATGCATPNHNASEDTLSVLDLARNKLRNKHATSSQKDVQQALEKQMEDVARIEALCVANREKELRRLVRLFSDHKGFTKESYKEALTLALADPVTALICFTSLARRAGLL